MDEIQDLTDPGSRPDQQDPSAVVESMHDNLSPNSTQTQHEGALGDLPGGDAGSGAAEGDEAEWPPPRPDIRPSEQELARLLLHAWFLDDGTFGGSLTHLAAAVGYLKRRAPELGLQLNTTKSVLWHPDSAYARAAALPPALEDLTLSNESGLTLLGGSVGEVQYTHQEVKKRFDKIRDVISRLEILQDPQVAYQFLRYCTGAPKASYIMRTTDPSLVGDLYLQFDQAQCDALGRIVGASLTTDSAHWVQASLPLDLGGLGIRSVSAHSQAAYVVSCLQTDRLVGQLLGPLGCRRDYRPAVGVLRELCSSNLIKPLPQNLSGVPQRMVSECIDLARLEGVVARSEPRHQAVIRSAALPHTGDFLNAVPCPALGLRMEGRAFTYACKYRLGLPVYQTDKPACSACVREPSDRMGDHAIAACVATGDRIRRHDLLRDRIFDTASAAVLAPRKEVRGLCEDRPERRPGDIVVQRWTGSPAQYESTAFDIMVTSPLHNGMLSVTPAEPRRALEEACKYKPEKYNPQANPPTLAADVHLVPLVVTTFGAWDEDAASHLRKFAVLHAQNKGLEHGTTIKHFFQRLSVTLQKMNAEMLIRRCPDSFNTSPALDAEH